MMSLKTAQYHLVCARMWEGKKSASYQALYRIVLALRTPRALYYLRKLESLAYKAFSESHDSTALSYYWRHYELYKLAQRERKAREQEPLTRELLAQEQEAHRRLGIGGGALHYRAAVIEQEARIAEQETVHVAAV